MILKEYPRRKAFHDKAPDKETATERKENEAHHCYYIPSENEKCRTPRAQ